MFNAHRVESEIKDNLERLGILGVDFDSPGGKEAFLSALKTRNRALSDRKAAEAARDRERRDEDSADPIKAAYGDHDDDEVENLGDRREQDDGTEVGGDPSGDGLDFYFGPRKSNPRDDRGDVDSSLDRRSAIERFLHPKQKTR